MEYPYDEDDDFLTVKTTDLLQEIKQFIRIIISEDQEQQLDLHGCINTDSNVAAATQVEDSLKQEEGQNCCIGEEHEQLIRPKKIPADLQDFHEEQNSSSKNAVIDDSRLTSFLYYGGDWIWKYVDFSEEEESEPESMEDQFWMSIPTDSFFVVQDHYVNPDNQECL